VPTPDARIIRASEAQAYGLAYASAVANADRRLEGELALDEDRLDIFDINGDILFYDFPLLAATRPIGFVRTAADERVGTPGVFVEIGERSWDVPDATNAAIRRVESIGGEVESVRLICYSYPKLGIEVVSGKAVNGNRGHVFDVASGNEVHTVPESESDQFAVRSFLTTVDVELKTTAFAQARAALGLFPPPGGPGAGGPMTTTTVQVWLDPPCQTTLGVPLYAQITDYNCVPASAEMILDHYGWNFSQSAIATAMGTTTSGTWYNPGVVSGIATLTNNTMTPAEPDYNWSKSQQWGLMATEISANRPVFTQMPGHYRVCVGYSETLNPSLFGPPYPVLQMLHIHDPWPWNANICQGGADYWENWVGTSVEWFVTLQH
jgi:Peptidase_C39 like family